MSIKNVVIGIAIIILTISVVIYGIGTFYARPDYEDFCGDVKTQELIETQERCEQINGKWSVYERVASDVEEPILKDKGFCDRDYYCRQDFDDALEKYSRNLFLMTLPIGIILIILGAVVFGLETVGAGMMGGGVGVILYGVGNYWQYSADLLKFILSLVGLIVVIWFSYWFNKKHGK